MLEVPGPSLPYSKKDYFRHIRALPGHFFFPSSRRAGEISLLSYTALSMILMPAGFSLSRRVLNGHPEGRGDQASCQGCPASGPVSEGNSYEESGGREQRKTSVLQIGSRYGGPLDVRLLKAGFDPDQLSYSGSPPPSWPLLLSSRPCQVGMKGALMFLGWERIVGGEGGGGGGSQAGGGG